MTEEVLIRAVVAAKEDIAPQAKRPGRTRTMGVRVREEVWEAYQELARRKGKSPSELHRWLLYRYLEQQVKEPASKP